MILDRKLFPSICFEIFTIYDFIYFFIDMRAKVLQLCDETRFRSKNAIKLETYFCYVVFALQPNSIPYLILFYKNFKK